MAPRHGGGAEPLGAGGYPVGAARVLPRFGDDHRQRPSRGDPGRGGLPGSPGGRRVPGRQRDFPRHRPVVRAPAHRGVPPRAHRAREEGRAHRAGRLRQLPLHRVPRDRLHRLPRLQRLSPFRARVPTLPLASAQPGRRPAARADRVRHRLVPGGRERAGRDAVVAGARRARHGRRGHGGVLLHRRMAHRRLRHPELGLRPGGPRAAAQAGLPCGAALVRGARAARAERVPEGLGGDLRLQRGVHDAGLSGVAAEAPVSGVRGHRGGRRLHRSHRRDRGPLRGHARHPPGEQGPERGPQRRHRGLARRDRGLHRFGLRGGPGLASLPGGHLHPDRLPGGGRPQPAAPGGFDGGGLRGRLAGRPAPRAAGRRGGRAHPGLQHGVPPRGAGGDRWVRSHLPLRG